MLPGSPGDGTKGGASCVASVNQALESFVYIPLSIIHMLICGVYRENHMIQSNGLNGYWDLLIQKYIDGYLSLGSDCVRTASARATSHWPRRDVMSSWIWLPELLRIITTTTPIPDPAWEMDDHEWKAWRSELIEQDILDNNVQLKTNGQTIHQMFNVELLHNIYKRLIASGWAYPIVIGHCYAHYETLSSMAFYKALADSDPAYETFRAQLDNTIQQMQRRGGGHWEPTRE